VSKKLLLADDSVTIQKVVNLTFADEGIEVITAGDGETAMQMLLETPPDLVMADVNMPGLSGYQLCERIKENDALKNTPVILLVGSFEPFDEEEARRVGADDFLTKPFQSIRQLVNKVTTLLESSANGETSNVVSGLDDTREFDKSEVYAEAGYGDAGMDDEMIDATASTDFSDEETPEPARGYDEKTENDLAVTQPLSSEDLAEITARQSESYSAPYAAATAQAYEQSEESPAAHQEEFQSEQDAEVSYESRESVSSEENREAASYESYEAASYESYATPSYESYESVSSSETYETVSTETNETASDETYETPSAEGYESSPAESREDASPAAVIEEDDLLEIPPVFEDEETPVEEDQAAEPASPDEREASAQSENQTSQTGAATVSLPPEVIDAIAQRVVEKISEKTLREIAKEVVPQQTELIKKIVEEKLKE
jgi:Response regulators consisting of a CheY-like receiver domain and a winged-helix DNA-binding domain